ncbi:MAG: hypothetical protein HRU03_01605 [Nanoarchaeales archaeon]|nr:hypothetical protein [Nanoarchaeales archaeon]
MSIKKKVSDNKIISKSKKTDVKLKSNSTKKIIKEEELKLHDKIFISRHHVKSSFSNLGGREISESAIGLVCEDILKKALGVSNMALKFSNLDNRVIIRREDIKNAISEVSF